MKAARLYSPTDIRIEDMPRPAVGPGEALVRTRACGICSGDAMPWYIEKKAPLVLGHEPVGEIAEVGQGVTAFSPGERVFVHHHAPCFGCACCRRGDYVHCETWKNTALSPGGVAEFFLVPEVILEHDTLPLPDEMDFQTGTLIEPLACVVKGMRKAGLRKGDTVLVIGLGAMGVLNGLMAKSRGVERLIGADMVPYRLEAAKRLGFDDVIDVSKAGLKEAVSELTSGGMAHLVVVCPNSAEAMQQGLGVVAPGGTVLFFSPAKPGETITFDANELYFGDISIVTSYSCGPTDTADALMMMAEGKIDVSGVITHRFPIEQTAEAYRLTVEAGESLKCVVVF